MNNVSTTQQDLFDATIAQQFDVWRQTPGGKFILNMAYKQAAGQAARFLHCGQRGSIRLVWETLRYRLKWIRSCARRKGVSLEKWGDYALNDHFHAHVARHIMEHRPEWDGLFERRALGAKRMVARRPVAF
jgi:hypothetical protein